MKRKVTSHCCGQVKAQGKALAVPLIPFCRQEDESALSVSFSLAWVPVTLLHFLVSPREGFWQAHCLLSVMKVIQFKEGTVITSH